MRKLSSVLLVDRTVILTLSDSCGPRGGGLVVTNRTSFSLRSWGTNPLPRASLAPPPASQRREIRTTGGQQVMAMGPGGADQLPALPLDQPVPRTVLSRRRDGVSFSSSSTYLTVPRYEVGSEAFCSLSYSVSGILGFTPSPLLLLFFWGGGGGFKQIVIL